MKMKICVLGSGALGSTIGGVLAEGGSEVYLIDQWADHVNEINRRGLLLREGTTDRTVKVEARADCSGIGPADLVIVLVKSFHTRQAIESAGAIIGDNTMVMSIQNGLGNDETLAEVVGKERLIGGKTYVGGVLLGAGHVIAGTKNKVTYIGEFDGTITDRITKVADVFNRAGLLTNISPNIVGMTWDKLLINVATGALSGITKLTYGGLYKVKEIEDCALAAVAEAMAVAEASGVTLSIKTPNEAWFMASDGLPDEFKTSILQSLEKGQKSEVDFINGSVVRWGEKYNVPTPVNRTLMALVKGIEYGMQDYPGKY